MRRTLLPLACAALAGCGGQGTPQSLVLACVEPIPGADLGACGNPDARTPFWDSLCRRGTQFVTTDDRGATDPDPVDALLRGGIDGAERDAWTMERALEKSGLRCGRFQSAEEAMAWVRHLPPHEPYFLLLHLRGMDADRADRTLHESFLRLGEEGRLDRTMAVATSLGEVDPGSLALYGPLPFRGGALREDPARSEDLLPTVLHAFRFGPDWRLPGRALQEPAG